MIESRSTQHGRRRRYSCTDCGHRDSTHEIPQHLFQQQQADAAALQQLRALLLQCTPAASAAADALPCDTCLHATDGACTLGLPEAFTPGASGCTYTAPTT